MGMNGKNGRGENRNSVEWKAKVGGRGLGVSAAIVRNVSLSGVYFETRAEFKVESRVLLEVHVEHAGKSRRLLVECEVRRCSSTDKSEIHGYGVRFMKLGRENLSFLLPLMAELWMEQKKSDKSGLTLQR